MISSHTSVSILVLKNFGKASINLGVRKLKVNTVGYISFTPSCEGDHLVLEICVKAFETLVRWERI